MWWLRCGFGAVTALVLDGSLGWQVADLLAAWALDGAQTPGEGLLAGR